jgi:hypothetical protein
MSKQEYLGDLAVVLVPTWSDGTPAAKEKH